jgi:AraC-like DNA-binding protein
LGQHHILHLGIGDCADPVKIMDSDGAASCFLAWLGGEGRIFRGGCWQVLLPGHACLLPVQPDLAFESVPGSAWSFCWVCYDRPIDQLTLRESKVARLARFEALPLKSAMLGLYFECTGANQPRLLQRWTDLVDAQVVRFSRNAGRPDALATLWERLATHIADHWTLERLASESGYSCEHLRRLCRAKLGRSPMQQVSYLRMRHAADLLTSTDYSIECIAHEVGYRNQFAFSNAFSRWIGWRPSDYRMKKMNGLSIEQGVS